MKPQRGDIWKNIRHCEMGYGCHYLLLSPAKNYRGYLYEDESVWTALLLEDGETYEEVLIDTTLTWYFVG